MRHRSRFHTIAVVLAPLCALTGCENMEGGNVVETPEYYDPQTFGFSSNDTDTRAADRPAAPTQPVNSIENSPATSTPRRR